MRLIRSFWSGISNRPSARTQIWTIACSQFSCSKNFLNIFCSTVRTTRVTSRIRPTSPWLKHWWESCMNSCCSRRKRQTYIWVMGVKYLLCSRYLFKITIYLGLKITRTQRQIIWKSVRIWTVSLLIVNQAMAPGKIKLLTTREIAIRTSMKLLWK